MTNLTLDVHTADGATKGSVELPAEYFDREASVALMHQVVNAQLAAARQGLSLIHISEPTRRS